MGAMMTASGVLALSVSAAKVWAFGNVRLSHFSPAYPLPQQHNHIVPSTAARVTLSAAKNPSASFPLAYPLTQVVSDIDDTLKSSGGVTVAGVALGGIDVQYTRGDVSEISIQMRCTQQMTRCIPHISIIFRANAVLSWGLSIHVGAELILGNNEPTTFC